MTLGAVADVVGGTVHDDDSSAVRITGAAFVDSRQPVPGGLFVAVVGERADGHDFAAAAVEAGAAAVLAARPTGKPTVVVPDPEAALQDLARHVLASLPRVRVIAITGSQGKTSAKDLLGQLLGRVGATVATAGSCNNELGLPLTVLRADESTENLVLEMGARGPGHLRRLCEIAPPHVSLVLNVGKAHLGEFGSREAIALAKGEIVEALPAEGLAVLNADDEMVAAMAARTQATVRTFGTAAGADVQLGDVAVDDMGRPSFKLHESGRTSRVAMRLVGEHQAVNAAAAAAVATACGMSLDAAADALSRVEATSHWRMELHERDDGLVVVNDAYNANPDSMRAALTTLSGIGRSTGRRTVAVLGEMCELGESSDAEHRAVGTLAVRLDIDQVLVVGEPARPLHQAAGGESVFVPDRDAALDWLREHLTGADVLLVKASRAIGLERLAEAVLADGADGVDR